MMKWLTEKDPTFSVLFIPQDMFTSRPVWAKYCAYDPSEQVWVWYSNKPRWSIGRGAWVFRRAVKSFRSDYSALLVFDSARDDDGPPPMFAVKNIDPIAVTRDMEQLVQCGLVPFPPTSGIVHRVDDNGMHSVSGRIALTKANMEESKKDPVLADQDAWMDFYRDGVVPKNQGIFTGITAGTPSESALRKTEVLEQICKEEVETFIRKNTDYGDSFANLRKELPTAVLVRIYDKWSRLKSLMKDGTTALVDESIDDTLMDLANYANMELLERRLEREAARG